MEAIMKLFYSWQSDIKNQKNIIEKIIINALKNIKKEVNIDIALDRDTKNKSGSIDIAREILNKINTASIFVGDITFVNINRITKFFTKDKYPNPNVLLELGYAIRKIGWERIILIFNKKYGKIEELPFDINHHRVLSYSGNLKELEKDIFLAVKLIISLGNNVINRDRDEEHDIHVFNRIMEDIPEENLEYLFDQFIQNRWYRYDKTRFISYTNEKIKQPKNVFINQRIQKAACDFGNSLNELSSFMALNCSPHRQNIKLGQLNNFEHIPYPARDKLLMDLLEELIKITNNVLIKFREFRLSVANNLGV
jgi:hypothetical protein